jgi:uncharacterized protein (DUF983 family)
MDDQASVHRDFTPPTRPCTCAPESGLIVRPGTGCPNCGQGKLDYNGLLELECPHCGYRINNGTYT